MIQELTAMPEAERHEALRTVLARLYPLGQKAIDRMLRRIENPDVPEDVWEGFEEAGDGKGIEMRDEHFENPCIL